MEPTSHDDSIKGLIFKYRMLGFDKPEIKLDPRFNCYTLEIKDPTGQWKLIKGKHEYACMVGALKWAKANWKTIQRDRRFYVENYINAIKYGSYKKRK